MKTLALLVAFLFVAAGAAAQPASPSAPAGASESKAPQAPPAGNLNLNLRLDDTTRRSVITEQASEQRAKSGAALPALGGGSGRSFDPPPGSRAKSTSGSGPYPKTVDTP